MLLLLRRTALCSLTFFSLGKTSSHLCSWLAMLKLVCKEELVNIFFCFEVAVYSIFQFLRALFFRSDVVKAIDKDLTMHRVECRTRKIVR